MHVVALEPLGLHHDPAVEQHRDGDEHEDRESFLRQHEQPVRSARQPVPERERGEHAGEQDFRASDRQDNEAPEDERVQRASHRITQDLPLGDAYREKIPDAPREVVPARFVLPDAQETVETLRAEGKRGERDGKDKQKRDVGWTHRSNIPTKKIEPQGAQGTQGFSC